MKNQNTSRHKSILKIEYDAPVIVTYAILIIVVYLAHHYLIPGIVSEYFFLRPLAAFRIPLDFFCMISYVFGHVQWQHLCVDVTFILLLGPIVEKNYGSFATFCMMLFTALFTGMVAVFSFSQGLYGASGIVCMFIIMSSLVNIRKHTLPASFILLAALFFITEFSYIFQQNDTSQIAHIIGGVFGAIFGLMFESRKRAEIARRRKGRDESDKKNPQE